MHFAIWPAFNNTAAAFTQTFVGEVEQGTLTVNILPGLNAISSKTPQAMDLSGNGFPQTGELIVYMLQPTGLYSFYQLIDGTWYDTVLEIPVNPTPGVGVGIFVENTGTSTFPWTRNFTVQ